MNTETIALLFSGFGGLCLLGGIVAMKFAVQAGRAPRDPLAGCAFEGNTFDGHCGPGALRLTPYTEDDTPESQRDTLPGRAPATLRSSAEGEEYGC